MCTISDDLWDIRTSNPHPSSSILAGKIANTQKDARAEDSIDSDSDSVSGSLLVSDSSNLPDKKAREKGHKFR